jgi:hypothetical protein
MKRIERQACSTRLAGVFVFGGQIDSANATARQPVFHFTVHSTELDVGTEDATAAGKIAEEYVSSPDFR